MAKHTYYYTYVYGSQVQRMSVGRIGNSESLVVCGRDTAFSSCAHVSSKEYCAHGGAQLCREGSAALCLKGCG